MSQASQNDTYMAFLQQIEADFGHDIGLGVCESQNDGCPQEMHLRWLNEKASELLVASYPPSAVFIDQTSKHRADLQGGVNCL